MERAVKEEVISGLKTKLAKAASVVLADFTGLTVETVTGLRREFAANQCEYNVIKNTLLERAIANTAMEGLTPLLKGPTVMALSFEDVALPAKISLKFAKEQEKKFVVKGGFAEGRVLDAAAVEALSALPGKDELRAMLLATFMAPPTEFARLLTAAPLSFVYLLQARGEALGKTA